MEVQVQIPINGSYHFPGHFPEENERNVPQIWICMGIHQRPFYNQ